MKLILLTLLPALTVATRPQLHFILDDFLGTWYMQYEASNVTVPGMMDHVETFQKEGDGVKLHTKYRIPGEADWQEVFGYMSIPDLSVPAATKVAMGDMDPLDFHIIFTDYTQMALVLIDNVHIEIFTRQPHFTKDQEDYIMNVANLAGINTTTLNKIPRQSAMPQISLGISRNVLQRFPWLSPPNINPWAGNNRWPFQL